MTSLRSQPRRLNRAMRYPNIIFDLDGTLVDSLPGIETSASYALRSCFPDRTLPPMRDVIGPPIRTMFARLFPAFSEHDLDGIVAAFRQHYDTAGCLRSVVYPEVERTLAELRRAGATMFVLTNKPAAATRSILVKHRLEIFFAAVLSPDSAAAPFTRKAQGAEDLRARFRLEPASTILVGDGVDDCEAATQSGFAFAIAGYGYGSATRELSGQRWPIAETFSEIPQLVL